ncbi:acyl-CoA reductase [Rhodoflexus caldus]|uniref:acyl-CoA reductase n=1 Tax=Rhodoflexus caldus TaxID=2891236 RepID=UPI00202AB153|nr:acyl-CoA reductase [Rhodoflexus caldus]
MMSHQQVAEAFIALGQRLRQLPEDELERLCNGAAARNSWFIASHVRQALDGIAHMLAPDALRQWLAAYDLPVAQPKTIGVIMAGNIPLAGFHDFLCVLLSGHRLAAKMSSQDNFLLPQLAEMLFEMAPELRERVQWTEQLKAADAIIATGSDNSSRYFQYYFGKYPHIIRQNRVSAAVLDGSETPEELAGLAYDAMLYFGLGCRSIAKLFVPEDYDFTPFLQQTEKLADLVDNHKYRNNYDYQKSIFLVNRVPHLDSGFVLLNENEALASPMSVIYYQYYRSREEVMQLLAAQADKLQCVAAHDNRLFSRTVAFGQTQMPGIADYADGTDTMAFLLRV